MYPRSHVKKVGFARVNPALAQPGHFACECQPSAYQLTISTSNRLHQRSSVQQSHPSKHKSAMDPAQSASLTRLLSRLQSTLDSPDSKLAHSPYERKRVGVNIEHARTLLLTLEKQSSTVRIQTQRQAVQTDLQKKREVVKALGKRLEELEKLGQVEPESSDESSEDDEEEEEGEEGTKAGLREYAPARTDTDAGLETGEPQESRISPPQQSELRARKPLSSTDNRSAASTTARQELFAGRKQHPDVETAETLMSHNRTEQEALTNGLLGLARALKESSVNFGNSLETEKEVLKRAEGGLDSSSKGMEAAERRMGMLRRMSEGQGWWGRMKLYAFIFGLWVVAFLLVFVGPKLRI